MRTCQLMPKKTQHATSCGPTAVLEESEHLMRGFRAVKDWSPSPTWNSSSSCLASTSLASHSDTNRLKGLRTPSQPTKRFGPVPNATVRWRHFRCSCPYSPLIRSPAGCHQVKPRELWSTLGIRMNSAHIGVTHGYPRSWNLQ